MHAQTAHHLQRHDQNRNPLEPCRPKPNHWTKQTVAAQLPVGPSPTVGSGEPGAAGPGLVGWGRNRRRADVSAAPGPRQHSSGRRPLPAWNGGTSALRWGQRTTHCASRKRLLHPRHRGHLPREARPLLHHRPPAPKPAPTHRGHTRGRLDAHTLLDGRRRRRGRD